MEKDVHVLSFFVMFYDFLMIVIHLLTIFHHSLFGLVNKACKECPEKEMLHIVLCDVFNSMYIHCTIRLYTLHWVLQIHPYIPLYTIAYQSIPYIKIP